MHVVATAGHVDHGKSALVRALTGMEPDRWEEERRRGLTLDLGFAWTRLPGGTGPATGTAGTADTPDASDGVGDGLDRTKNTGSSGRTGDGDGHARENPGGELAFVDVPGHERLVTNMLAGVGPVPAVLFVVAADQGWQAQSEEHLAVLHALGVRHGLLAVTRSDLADPAPVREDALARLAATSLGEVAAVGVSAVTGAGLEELRASLSRLVAALPPPDTAADPRLWVDRVFTVRGRGTVATGTLAAGTLRVGDRLAVGGQEGEVSGLVRVRGLQSLRTDRERVSAVARVAVDVHGKPADGLRRGDTLLAPGRWAVTRSADVRLAGDTPGELPRFLTLHAGSAAVPVAVRPLGEDTVRLSWDRPLPLRIGDRALLRDPGRHRVAAGVTVLDPRPPRLARRGAGAARARELATLTGRPDGASELRRRGLVRRGELLALGVPDPPEAVAGDWLADPAHWAALHERLVTAVREHARRHPLAPGLPAETARQALGLPDRTLVEALALSGGTSGTDRQPLRYRAGRLYAGAVGPELPEEVRAAVETVRRELADAPFRAPDGDRLAGLGLTSALQSAAAAAGTLLKVADGVVLLPGSDARAAELLARLDQPFTLSQARQALDTTRRVAVPLLEHLDAQGWTVRLDGTLRRCRTAAADSDGP